MALRYIDSMGDHYGTADATLKWTAADYLSRGPGLHGYAMKGFFSKGMLFGSTTLVMECYINHLSGGAILLHITDTGQLEQINCSRNSDGSIQVDLWGGSGPIFRSPPDLVRLNTWYHFGWKVLLHRTAGSVEIRLDGGTICNLTGIQTAGALGSNAVYWSGVIGSFQLGSNANSTWFDDLVVMDDVADGINDPRLPGGGGFTTFIGPVEVRVKRPSGPGLSADFTPTPTVANYLNVDDTDPDGDTTVNTAASTAVGATDLFAMEDLLPGEDVLAVQSLVLARKTQEGTAALAKVSHDGTTTRAGATIYQPSTYSYMHAPEPTAPDGTLWTAAKWNAMQYGYRRII